MESNALVFVDWRDDDNICGIVFVCVFLWEKIKFKKKMSVRNGDIVCDGHSIYRVKPNSQFGIFLNDLLAPDPNQTTPGDFVIGKDTIKKTLNMFLNIDSADINRILTLIEQKPELQFFADRTSINLIVPENMKKVLPLTPAQVMERKVLDDDVRAVNKQIEDTFDGCSALVRNVKSIICREFENFGWSVRKHELLKGAYVFSPKEK
jgi:hypothetical protein